MAIGYIDDGSLHDIADAIRGKGGSGTFLPSEMASAITAITPVLQDKTVDPYVIFQTVQPDAGYDGLSSVTVNAIPLGSVGTPVATKGSVSNHSIDVVPSVTSYEGYIAGGTKTGTAVTVSASELVSGSETKTANGTYDVTNLASLVVSVSGGGGATNVVTGTFTCQTTTGTAQSISIPYSGSGYPVMVAVYPAEGGYNSSGSLYSLVQRYVVAEFFAVKAVLTSSPTYATSGTQNQAHVVSRYKSSTSSSTSYSSGASTTANFFSPTAPTASNSLCLRFSDDTTMKVFVAASSYGFHAGTTYAYVIRYSS